MVKVEMVMAMSFEEGREEGRGGGGGGALGGGNGGMLRTIS